MMSKAVHTHIAMFHFKKVNTTPPIRMTYQAMAMECDNQQIASNWAFLKDPRGLDLMRTTTASGWNQTKMAVLLATSSKGPSLLEKTFLSG